MAALQEITDVVAHFRHQVDLKSFEDRADHEHFPLDGSMWARLVSMRMHVNQHIADFWTKLHSTETLLRHERKAIQRAMQYWFLGGAQDYDMLWRYAAIEPSGDLAWQHILNCRAGDPVSLADAEDTWLNSKLQSKARPEFADQSSYWIQVEKGAFEGARAEKNITIEVCNQKLIVAVRSRTLFPGDTPQMNEDVHICPLCYFEYEECSAGQKSSAASSFDALPANWRCPICGALKDSFHLMDDGWANHAKFVLSFLESATSAYQHHPQEAAKSEKTLTRLGRTS